jgi:hypothetical protein
MLPQKPGYSGIKCIILVTRHHMTGIADIDSFSVRHLRAERRNALV